MLANKENIIKSIEVYVDVNCKNKLHIFPN